MIEAFIIRNIRDIGIASYAVIGVLTYGSLSAASVRDCAGDHTFACRDPLALGVEGGALVVQGAAWPLYWTLHLSTKAFQ